MLEAQNQREDYRDAVHAAVVDGVYDDHDYGENDAGRHYQDKNNSMHDYLDFLRVARDSTRRTPHRQGLYSSHTWGALPRQARIVILDTRYLPRLCCR